ncbi:MAG: WcaI family glycosyltransferase [Chitinophagaceae bacterium]|nr:WcaI family glycosyltransferase [Chitinophagaceae bacterium]
MLKKILLIGGNYSPELTGIGRYNGEMMDWLAENGYNCTVITTYPYYPQWKIGDEYRKKSRWYTNEKKGTINVYRCPHYVPGTPGGLKRMMLDFTFTISGFFKMLQVAFGPKRDVVIVVTPPFLPGVLAVLYKWLRGAKMVYHVQDLQIEAARDLKMVRSKMMIKMMFGIERFFLKRADHLSSISTGMVRKMKEKTGRETLLFPNWSDTAKFHPLLKDGLKQAFGFDESDKVVLYSGAIGEKQGLEIILNVAEKLKNTASLKFVICGTGPYKANLEELAKEMKLDNLLFMPLQPTEALNKFLNMADAHLVVQKADASDLVMPSKLTNILAVGGLAIVTANPGNSLYDEVDKHQIGLLTEAENSDMLAATIFKAVNENITTYKTNARQYAENYLSLPKVMQRFVNETGISALSSPVIHTETVNR